MALSAPFLFEEVMLAFLSSKDALIESIMRFIRGIVAGLIVLVSESLHECVWSTDLAILVF